MKYIITESKIQHLIGEFISRVYPNFSKGRCYSENMGNDDDPMFHYFTKENGVFAKYHPWTETLFLRKKLYETLGNYFGYDAMSYIIDWFNKEFDRDATSIDYF
jgi:hypothetical protein